MTEHVAVTGGNVHVVVNSGPARLEVKGSGDPLGAVLGNVPVNNADAAGVAVSGWTANDAAYGDDSHSNRLIGPLEPKKPQLGFFVLVQRGGSTLVRRARLFAWGAYGTYRIAVSEDNSYAEAVDLKYDGDDAGVNPFFEVRPVAGKAVPDGTIIYVHAANAAPDTSFTAAEVAAIRAEQSHLEAEIANIHGQTESLPPSATQAEAEAGDGAFQRLWSPLRIVQLVAAWLTRAKLAFLMGGWMRTASVSGNTLSLVRINSDGTSETIPYTPEPPAGGGGITVGQATAAAGALLSTLPEFTFDATTNTLTYTAPAAARPTNVTLSELAAALQTLINSHLTARSAPVVALQDFMAALRKSINGPAGAWTQNVGGHYEALTGHTFPRFKPDAVLTLTVQRDGRTAVVRTVKAAVFEVLVARQADNGADTNGIRFDNAGDAETYYVSKDATRTPLVQSDTAGRHTLASSIDDVTIDVADQIPDGSIEGQKLADDVQAKLDATSLTLAQVDAEIHRLTANVDVIATAQAVPAVSGNGHSVNWNLAFAYEGDDFTIVSSFVGGVGDPSFYVGPAGSRDNRNLLALAVIVNVGTENQYTLQIANAVRSPDEAGHDEFRWEDEHGGRPPFENPCSLAIVAPPSAKHYVPGTGTTGNPLVKTADGSAFQQLGTTGIAPAAVTANRLEPGQRQPDPSRLVNGWEQRTENGAWAAKRPRVPNPAGQTDGRILKTAAEALVYVDDDSTPARRVETAPASPRHGQRILMLSDQTLDGWGVLKAGRYSTGPIGYGSAALYTRPYGSLRQASDGAAFSTAYVQAVHSGASGGNTEIWTNLTTQRVSKLLIATLDDNGAPSAFSSHVVTNVPDGGGQPTHQNLVRGNPAFETGKTYLVKIEDDVGNDLFPSVLLAEPDEFDWGDGRWVRVTQRLKPWALEGGPSPTLADMGIVRLTQAAYNALGAGVDPGTLYVIIG